jgi:hypothetical protein
MPAALWLLLKLRFGGWLRRLGRSMRTVKGALLVVFVALMFGCWFSSLFLAPQGAASYPEAVRRYGTLFLLAYCLLMLLTTAGERAVSFSPAEVNFLFAGPFSRRQLLAYKIVGNWLISLATGLFMAVCFRMHARWLLASYVALVLVLIFLQLLAMTVALVGSTLGAHAMQRSRKWLLIGLGVLVAAAALSLGRDALAQQPPGGLLQQFEQSPVVQVVLAPLRWFVEAFTADNLADLLRYAGLAALVDGVLLLVVFLLDAHYLETAAASSERVYAMLQRMRSGGGPWALQSGSPGKRPRFGLPDLPWWGGVGPPAWRQLLAALRNLKVAVFVLFILALSLLPPMLAGQAEGGQDSSLRPVLASMVFLMSIFMVWMLPYDFRGDVDRMDLLKSLPLPPSRLVIGQLLAPVLMLSVMQLVCLAVIEAVLGGIGPVLLAAAFFAVPFNALVFEVMNLLFLWFPTRMVHSSAADFQLVGRQMLLMFGLYLILMLLSGVVALVAVLAYFVAGESWPAALAAAWVLLAGLCAALVPLLALAFRQFDVARDTPP